MINLVVTCAKRKRIPVAPELRLGGVLAEGPVAERAAAWLQRLSEHKGPRLPAGEMYVGEQWAIVRTILRERPSVRLWICSAGYGLVRVDEELAGYSATFSSDHPDAVNQRGISLAAAQRAWWAELGRRLASGSAEGPFGVEAIATKHPDEPLVVSASPVYLRAMGTDLLIAERALREPALLTVFSGGASGSEAGHALVRFGASLSTRLGGSMMSLNVRVVREALRQEWPLRRTALQREVDRLSESLPTFEYPKRSRLSDEEVLEFIRSNLDRGEASQSALLRELRTGRGRACEQKRFRRLYGIAAASRSSGSASAPGGIR